MKGWIKSIRNVKGFVFLATTDGCSEKQVTLPEGKCEIIGELKVGASFEATGVESTTPNGKEEFLANSFTIIGKSDDSYPIQPKKHSFDFLRTIPETRGRTRTFQAVFQLRHYLSMAIHEYFTDKGFVQYWAPIITTGDCEGAGETFKVSSDWMEENLTVSAQLHGEVGMMALSKIYTFGPCFRAEKSTTRKHLSEFYMVEPEVAFCKMDEAIDLTEDFVKSVLLKIATYKDTIQRAGGDLNKILNIATSDFIRLRYSDVCEKYELVYGNDISSELEKAIVADYGVPVFITHWPKDLKPFYMKKDSDVAYCFDLIFPEVGELVGGSEREDDYDILKTAMEESGMDMEKMDWYLSTRKWGSVPHSGFGLGFDRLLTFITGMEKIHDVIPFPVHY